MIDFTPYARKNNTDLFTGIPIQYLEVFKYFHSKFSTTPIKIRYRGPRNTAFDSGRSSISKQSTCLKINAVTFTVYKDNRRV
jgi:hypothetical protein